MQLKQIQIDFDVWLGNHFLLEQPLTTVDKNLDLRLEEGIALYTTEEWETTRKKGYNKIGPNGANISSDEKYINHFLCSENRKLLAVLSLIRSFNFYNFKSIFEIGCGEMIQAFVINQFYPDVRYLATDVDPYIIEKCSKLRILNGIEKSVFNAITDPHAKFKNFDLIISWGVEYAIDSTNLLKLLKSAKEYSIPFLICTQQIIGPLRYISRKIKTRSFNPDKLKKKNARLHGWTRSIKYFNKLAEKSHMKLELISGVSNPVWLDSKYHIILFIP